MSPLVLILILYPLVGMATPVVFYTLWPQMRPPVPKSSVSAATETEKAAMARLHALISLFIYGCLICGTLAWHLFSSENPGTSGFLANSRLSSALIGGYLGVSWAGVSIWLLALGAATGRMRREIPGLMAPLKVQVAVWLVGALAEETWRVTAIAALLTSQNSPLFSIVAVSVAFGSGYLNLGLQRAAAASLEGAFFGFLFLWQGSFLAPITAHLAVQAVYLWGVGPFPLDRQSRKTWQIPGTTCPVCHTQLKLLQIKLSEVFECPSCKERLSLSDGYQNVMRFAAAFGFCSLVLLTLILLTDWIPGNLGAWLTYPVSYGFATSCLFLYRRAFTRLFPPRLQRGTPHFITLNLAVRPRTKAAEGEDNETNE
ncbi:MAG TPA: CPBP family intramembrane glutamic endopeptidase [Candidatus Acidoferrum sp.]|nr:CPBP family intramembrane glutamic endopeptidase [Candidatus Acidoferrum sp.]